MAEVGEPTAGSGNAQMPRQQMKMVPQAAFIFCQNERLPGTHQESVEKKNKNKNVLHMNWLAEFLNWRVLVVNLFGGWQDTKKKYI